MRHSRSVSSRPHFQLPRGAVLQRIWSSADFSDANFRLRITNVATDMTRDFRLDWVALQVTYTPP